MARVADAVGMGGIDQTVEQEGMALVGGEGGSGDAVEDGAREVDEKEAGLVALLQSVVR